MRRERVENIIERINQWVPDAPQRKKRTSKAEVDKALDEASLTPTPEAASEDSAPQPQADEAEEEVVRAVQAPQEGDG